MCQNKACCSLLRSLHPTRVPYVSGNIRTLRRGAWPCRRSRFKTRRQLTLRTEVPLGGMSSSLREGRAQPSLFPGVDGRSKVRSLGDTPGGPPELWTRRANSSGKAAGARPGLWAPETRPACPRPEAWGRGGRRLG